MKCTKWKKKNKWKIYWNVCLKWNERSKCNDKKYYKWNAIKWNIIKMCVKINIYYILKVHDGFTRKKRNTLENPIIIRNIWPSIWRTNKLWPFDLEISKRNYPPMPLGYFPCIWGKNDRLRAVHPRAAAIQPCPPPSFGTWICSSWVRSIPILGAGSPYWPHAQIYHLPPRSSRPTPSISIVVVS